MEIKEHIKIIPERKEVTYTYHGKCPICGFEQNMNWNSPSLDEECSECKQKRQAKGKQEFLDTYIDATVLKIENDNRIIIKTKNGKVYELYNLADYYEGHCKGCTRRWEIYEIHEGNAEWFND